MTVRSGIRSRVHSAVAAGALTSLVAVGLHIVLADGAEAVVRRQAPAVQKERSVPGADLAPRVIRPKGDDPSTDRPARPEWPGASKSTVDLAAGKKTKVAASPVWLTSTDGARVEDVAVHVLGRDAAERAGVRGLLLQVGKGAAGKGSLAAPSAAITDPVSVSVGYAGLETAYGGDWVSRLRLVEMPDCIVTTPTVSACREGTPLPSQINPKARTVTAQPETAGSGATTLALMAGATGNSGDYAATPMAPSAVWNTSLQTGDFGWSYPLRTPPSLNGPKPSLSVSYSSGSVDGRTASTNNQPSWLGEGHSLGTGFIERQYVPCSDDMTDESNNKEKTGDLCWRSNNAAITFGGMSGELVRKGASDEWRLKHDDGSRFEKVDGADNGDNNGEYWRLTMTDGTRYYFGRDTNSAATVPVFGNHVGEQCRESAYETSFCDQAWRWNLDYVVDVNGNTMTYSYATETNRYGRNVNKSVSSYERATYLTSIEYGTRQGSSAQAPARVEFKTEERCKPTADFDCDASKLNDANSWLWPDVPFDQICTSATSCPNRFSPTFFSRKRLTGVTTRVWNGTTYQAVDSWAFDQSFPASGDATSRSLWLESIQHTGHVGGSVTLPKVGFLGTQMANRVDGLDQAPPLMKRRISSITSEAGGVISVNYTPKDCTTSDLPQSQASNTRRCFPVKWASESQNEPQLHYFHKYLVDSVVESDPAGGAEDVVSSYEYKGGAAWHYDDNELTKPKHKTYGEFRGYEKVAVLKGGDGSRRTYEEHLFMRGMYGDRLPDGSTRTAAQTDVIDSEGGRQHDWDRLNGFEREQIVRDGPSGEEVSGQISTPWISEPTASEPGDEAQILKVGAVRTRTPLESGTTRVTVTKTTYDDYGMPYEVDDLGSTGGASDDLCTRTYYARNTSDWIVDTPKRIETVSASCDATASRPTDVVSDVRMYYDSSDDVNEAPTRGRLTKTESAHSWNGGPIYRTKQVSAHDGYGRETKRCDGLNNCTTTEYTQEVGSLPTQVKTTNAAGHTQTNFLNRAWGQTYAEVDANSRRTDLDYDPLGRLSEVWLPGRSKSGGATSNMRFSYSMNGESAPYVKSEERLNDGTYAASYQIMDSLLRPRQTQMPAADASGGRILADTKYDSRGFAIDQYGAWFNAQAPAGTIFKPQTEVQIPALTKTTYDGAGRPILDRFESEGVEKWRTTTRYGGDRVHVDPPAGTTPTTSIVDARGRTTELRRYQGSSASGDYETLRYAYEPDGKPSSITDPGGSRWTYDYDLAGRLIESNDPDRGKTTSTYDAVDRLVTTTDANGTLWRKYDVLGRQTELRDDSSTGSLRATWDFDMTGGKGMPAGSTRYVDGNEYKVAVTGYDPVGRPSGTRVVIPASEGTLQGTYESKLTFNSDGSLKSKVLPTVPGVPSETLNFYYNKMGRENWFSGYGSYVAETSYSPYGEPLQVTMGQTVGKFAWQTNQYETGTRRLAKSRVDVENLVPPVADVHYEYDASGNVMSIADKPDQQAADIQCFKYDHAQRLTHAFTVATGTCGIPSVTNMGTSPSSYWHSYTYDDDGNRATEEQHKASGLVTRTYGYDATQPHALDQVTTADPSGSVLETFDYDGAGNLASRERGSETKQDFTWDKEGRVAGHTGASGETKFVYDADGTRLLRKDPSGTTLYLDETEVRLNKSTSTKTSTRYYTHAGSTVAVRTSAGVKFLADDHQGSTTVEIDAKTLAWTKGRALPFGDRRGDDPAFTGDRGFVGGTEDASTGLTHLGVREYDQQNGRFISVDPIMHADSPAQMNGYAYADHSPITLSDPSGLERYCGDAACPAGTTKGFNNPGGFGGEPKGGGHEGEGTTPPEVQEAEEEVNEAQGDYDEAKQRAIEVAKKLTDILAEELGIEDALTCVTTGDLGACAETALNLATNVGFGLAGKLATKYAWRWKKAANLVKTIGGLLKKGVDAIGDALKSRKTLKRAEDSLDTVRKSCNSFVPGTTVLMADGSRKPIEEVRVGEQVLATDPITGTTVARTVVATIIGSGLKHLVRVTVDLDGDKGDRTGVVVATDEHPFWVDNTGEWTNAEDLEPGDQLRTPSGALVEVLRIHTQTRTRTVHNLTIDQIHTYYVDANGRQLLVHNDSCPRNKLGQFTSGENADASLGRSIHRDSYPLTLGGNYDFRVVLPSGLKPDAVDWEKRIVRELKSDAASSQRTGKRQLQGYVDELEETTGEKWTGYLDTYSR